MTRQLDKELYYWALDNGWTQEPETMTNLDGQHFNYKTNVPQIESVIRLERERGGWNRIKMVDWAKEHGYVLNGHTLGKEGFETTLQDGIRLEQDAYHHIAIERRKLENKELYDLVICLGWELNPDNMTLCNPDKTVCVPCDNGFNFISTTRTTLMKVARLVRDNPPQEPPKNRGQHVKRRWAEIRLLAAFYDIPKMQAQDVYEQLKKDGELEEVLQQAVKDVKPAQLLKCPLCKAPMIRRTSLHGPFLGCSRFPECKGLRKIDSPILMREEKVDANKQRLDLTIKFVKEMGNTQIARKWLTIYEGMEADE